MEASDLRLPKNILYLFLLTIIVLLEKVDFFQGLMGINQSQEIALVIMIFAAFLWITEFVPLFVTSFIILFLQLTWLLPSITASGGKLTSQQLFSPFFSDIILLFLGGFVLSSLLNKFKLGLRVAQWILGQTGGNPSRILLAIIFTSSFLSMWMSNTATAAMMFAIVLPIIHQFPDTSPFRKALALAIPFACNIGGMGTPIGTPPNAIAMTYLAKNGVSISFAEWMLLAVPATIILLFFVWKALMRLFPQEKIEVSIEVDSEIRLSQKHYLVIVIFLCTCLGWLTTDLHGLSTGTVSLLPIIVCFGLKLLNTNDFRELSWDILFMLGGGLCLGVGLEASGLTGRIIEMIPVDTTFFVLLIAMALIATIMSTFISNTATANLIIPLAVAVDMNSGILVATLALVCSGSMALPVSTPPNAIAFASGVIRSKDMVIAGSLVTIATMVIVLLLGNSYWKLFGL